MSPGAPAQRGRLFMPAAVDYGGVMNASRTRFGSLDCIAVDALPGGVQPQSLVILCHGFGAPGNDLVGLAPEIVEREPGLGSRLRFLFPTAPLAPEEFAMFGGRAWWPLNVASLADAIERGELRDQRRYSPVELPQVRKQILELVDEATQEAGLDCSQVVLGGFSQGSMVAVDAALHMRQAPLGLCVYSGTLLCEDEWSRLAERRRGLKVLQTHGRQDPILPFEGAVWLREMFEAAGANVEFVPFNGQHTIPLAAIDRTAAMLVRLLNA